MPLIQKAFTWTNEDTGIIITISTLAYALGKLVSGPLVDRVGGKRMFLASLFLSALFSATFGLGASMPFFIFAWSLNRFALSGGWNGLIRVVSRWYAPEEVGTACGLISVNYQLGNVVSLFAVGALVSLGFGWRELFFVPAVWLVLFGVVATQTMKEEPRDIGEKSPPWVTDSASVRARGQLWRDLGELFRMRGFILICSLSVILTFIRALFMVWTPTYLNALGGKLDVAAFKSAIFPFMGCLGTILAGWISDHYGRARRGGTIALMLVVLTACLFVLAAFGDRSQILGFVALGLIGFFLYGPYSLVTGVAAIDFGGTRLTGTAAGFIDAVGYVGAALSGIGGGFLSERYSWSTVFYLLVFCSALATALGFVLTVRERNR